MILNGFQKIIFQGRYVALTKRKFLKAGSQCANVPACQWQQGPQRVNNVSTNFGRDCHQFYSITAMHPSGELTEAITGQTNWILCLCTAAFSKAGKFDFVSLRRCFFPRPFTQWFWHSHCCYITMFGLQSFFCTRSRIMIINNHYKWQCLKYVWCLNDDC